MRKLKGSGNYLRNQTYKNLGKATICALLLGLIGLALVWRFLAAKVGFLEEVFLAVLIGPLVGFYYYLHKYRVYKGGWAGEKRVAKLLEDTLNDEYSLLNGLNFYNGGGDIDHVVLGPTGVFVIETKNWSGRIVCNGDECHRPGGRPVSGSPSEQAKKNAAKVRHKIGNSQKLPFIVQVIPIVVFTNNNATLQIRNSTVPILKLEQLPNYIISHGSDRDLSRHVLDIVAKEILTK
jgi:hypothetical protein